MPQSFNRIQGTHTHPYALARPGLRSEFVPDAQGDEATQKPGCASVRVGPWRDKPRGGISAIVGGWPKADLDRKHVFTTDRVASSTNTLSLIPSPPQANGLANKSFTHPVPMGNVFSRRYIP